ncbi:uncharacterized protein (TIGR03083 family) [Nocardioides ginsengisegetis]|uniref:Uncharacterized protein (TIGR03083 family) n=1 Tax=Nocardioides ginsengisegetis TaxID=661491 RepID=A0A7W3P975_9ACTN|nr:maleylpyruvate isomerase family mycothiol-dependent enzyme [Nocardioides ginsengisegetis]MBA8803141.1 uncharacterized protein (TIGR03083 family) [Nocardioides ginsengisegetis]
MANIEFRDYLRAIRDESHRFREVLTDCDPAARVPGCPAWDADDLLWHLAETQWFWARTVRERPDSPDDSDDGPERPEGHDALLEAFDDYSAQLVTELGKADPADTAWTWSAEQTVGFIHRRQAHEALVHRLDAEQAAGAVTPLDPRLAADGVEECLDVMFGAAPSWGTWHPLQHFLRVDCTDTGDSVWVQVGRFTGTNPADGTDVDEDDIRVVDAPRAEPDAVIEGPAGALDAWLWRRSDDAEIKVHGDRGIYGHFRKAVNHPID